MAAESQNATLSSRPKGDKRERTRAKLLEAARALIREKGYEHTTLEDIAEKAGMTTGAIYGNFKNREDLFIALGQTYWTPIRPRVRLGSSLSEVMSAIAEATIAAVSERSAAIVGRLTGLAYAISADTMRAQVTRITAESYAIGEEWLRSAIQADEFPMPPAHLVRVIHALTEGLILQRLLTPSLVPDQVIRDAFAALGGAAARGRM